MNIDQAAVELVNEMSKDSLTKGLPPKLLYRFRRWLRTHAASLAPNPAAVAQVKKALVDNYRELEATKTLQKNEMLASFYDSGAVKLDFGPGVPDKMKKAAIDWAKRKGLKPVEASLNKSKEAFNFVVMNKENVSTGSCLKRIKLEF
ncbi:MAG: hypothetical protein ACREGB_01700 [Candidatus Saccharimonadales bacterium]